MRNLILVASVIALAAGANAHDLTDERIEFRDDKVSIVDGDTVWIGIHQIRLHGIDTVEPNQQCLDGQENVGCHELTVKALADLIDSGEFHCHGHIGKDKHPRINYGRYVATCYTNGIEVNRAMVESGWAVAAKNDGEIYKPAEHIAKEANLGLHQWEFEHPHEFRNPPSEECTCD